jgi:DNA-binding NtrC family response regulator
VAESEISLAGLRGLVLDDEFLIALDIQQILESAGAAECVCVAGLDQAIAALRDETKFDFAVIDVKIGSRGGNSLAVAAVLTHQRVPFVFLTAMSAEDGATAQFPKAPVVEKPYQAPMLLDAIARALKRE